MDEQSAMELKRVSTNLSEAEVEAVDAWGFARKIRDRTEVIRQLVRRGLEASATE